MNKNIKTIDFLLRNDFISEPFVRTLADICLHEVKANIEKELGFAVSIDDVREAVAEAMRHFV